MSRTPWPGRPAATPRRRCQAGFSLIELLVVVVLIGILVGLAVPRLDFPTPGGAASAEHASDARAVRVERATGGPSWFRYGLNEWTREF